MSFCTAVNCIDGRVQRPVLEYLTDRYKVQYVDSVTEPGPNAILGRPGHAACVESILGRIDVSVHKHRSVAIAVIGHYDCAGNPGDRDHQNSDTRAAVQLLRSKYPETPVIGLYVDETWTVEEIEILHPAH